MDEPTCSIEGCNKTGKLARGWCTTHYARWRKYGDPLKLTRVVLTPDTFCTIDGCDRPVSGRGLCQKHYMRRRRRSDPLVNLRPETELSYEECFWLKVNKDGPPSAFRPDLGQCWLWTASLDTRGYGNFRDQRAHRVSYELTVGPIEDGLELDHLCRVITCVNPSHLEPVTRAVNMTRRGEAELAERGNLCRNGLHEMTPANTYSDRFHPRLCRACVNAKVKRYYDRKNGDAA